MNYSEALKDIEEKFQQLGDKFNWVIPSRFMKLPESFIEKYADQVSWENISQYQELSEPFIEKYRDRLVFN